MGKVTYFIAGFIKRFLFQLFLVFGLIFVITILLIISKYFLDKMNGFIWMLFGT